MKTKRQKMPKIKPRNGQKVLIFVNGSRFSFWHPAVYRNGVYWNPVREPWMAWIRNDFDWMPMPKLNRQQKDANK